jgi:hypothetical protein
MAQVVECLLYKHKVHSSNPVPPKKKKKVSRPGTVVMPVISALKKYRQEGYEFKGSLGYTVSTRPA